MKLNGRQLDFRESLSYLTVEELIQQQDQIGITEEREETYYFTDPYFYVPYRIVVQEDRDDINSVKDLYGKKLGLLTDDIACFIF